MRPIKFRAWDKEDKEFLNIKSFGFFEDGEVWYVQAIDEGENELEPPYFTGEDDLVIMQYTGLKDKNGREIYEGDEFHLGDPNITYAVVWQDTGLKGKQNRSSSYVGLSSWQEKIEVIGSIFDPELVDAK